MTTKSLKTLGNIHHAAFRCLDAEQTRWFYEDVMGLPMKIAFRESMDFGEGEPRDYLHLFFESADGNYIAFFDHPETASKEHFARKDGFDVHLAFETETYEELIQWQELINSHGRGCYGPIDHGFVTSIYVYDPNGIQIEIAWRNSDTSVLEHELKVARQQLSDWTDATREKKLQKFGELIDRRGNPAKMNQA